MNDNLRSYYARNLRECECPRCGRPAHWDDRIGAYCCPWGNNNPVASKPPIWCAWTGNPHLEIWEKDEERGF